MEKKLFGKKHSSLFCRSINDDEKSIIKMTLLVIAIDFFQHLYWDK
jgi:hypothetical protein